MPSVPNAFVVFVNKSYYTDFERDSHFKHTCICKHCNYLHFHFTWHYFWCVQWREWRKRGWKHHYVQWCIQRCSSGGRYYSCMWPQQSCSVQMLLTSCCGFSVCAGEKASNSPTPQSPQRCWFKNLLSESDAKIMEHSGKMVILFEILRMAENIGEKVYASGVICLKFKLGLICKTFTHNQFCFFFIARLVFSQSLITLNLIEKYLEASHRGRDIFSSKGNILWMRENIDLFRKCLSWWCPCFDCCFFFLLTEGSWIKNIDYFRLDGSTSAPLRKKCIDEFNQPGNVRYAPLHPLDSPDWNKAEPLVGSPVLCRIVFLCSFLGDDCFSFQQKQDHLASTLWLPTGSSSSMRHGTPLMTSRAYTECTASASWSQCSCTVSWLRWTER